jgi:hypothetical protein
MKSFKILSITILFLTGLVNYSFAQKDSVRIDSVKLLDQANQMAAAFINADYKKMAKFTHPNIMQVMGGEEKMILLLTSQIEKLKTEGISFKSATITGFPSKILRAGTEIHTYIPETIVMEVPGGTLTAYGHLLAISRDSGVNWYFADRAGFESLEMLKSVFPNYNSDLEIPVIVPPVFRKNE